MKNKTHKGNQKLSKDAKLLDQYLSRYYNCIISKNDLLDRRKNILEDFNTPLTSVKFSGDPKAKKESLGCAALSFRLDEIDGKILEQLKDAEKSLNDIMSIIDTLPANTIERNIIEKKYIDRLSWNKISQAENISRNAAFYNWRAGLNKMLEFKRVQKILKDYEKTL